MLWDSTKLSGKPPSLGIRGEGSISESIDLADGETDKRDCFGAETPAQPPVEKRQFEPQLRLGLGFVASGDASDRVRTEEAKRFVEQRFARLHAMPC